jgi:hypothetical protein
MRVVKRVNGTKPPRYGIPLLINTLSRSVSPEQHLLNKAERERESERERERERE